MMLSLIPEKYKHDIEVNVYYYSLQNVYNALRHKYQIIEIVPCCQEELIKMNTRDLLIENISRSHTGEIDVSIIESFTSFKRLDEKDNSGYSLDTVYQYGVYGSGYLSDTSKGHEGFRVVKNSCNSHIAEYITKYLADKYNESFIFKIKSKDNKKITIDIPTLEFLKSFLDVQDFSIAKKNFKRINKYETLLGEESA